MKLKNNKIERKFPIICIMAFPILSPYKVIGPISFGTILLLIGAISCIKNNKKIIINKPLTIMICIHMIFSLISVLIQKNYEIYIPTMNSIIMVFLNSILIMQFINNYDNYILDKVFRGFAFLVVGFIIYQSVFIKLGITPHNGMIFKELVSGYSWSNSIIYRRPNSFFAEPSYFSIYVLPLLAYFLLNKKYIMGIIIYISIIFSTSTLGIIGGGIVIIYIIIINYDIKIKLKLIYLLPVLFLIMIFLVNKFNLYWIIEQNLVKIQNLNTESAIRFTGNLKYFICLNNVYKFIGVGIGQLANHLYILGINAYNYSNGIIIVLFNYGILGLIIFIYTCVIYFKNLTKEKKIYMIIFLLICIIDYFIYTPNFYYILFFILIYMNGKNVLIKTKI